MQAKIRKYGGFVLTGALAPAAGIAGGGGDAISANLPGSGKEGLRWAVALPALSRTNRNAQPTTSRSRKYVVIEPNADRK